MPDAVHDIFISHANEDHDAIAEPLCRYLEDAGFRCWIAPRDIPLGDPFSARLTRGITRCRCVLVIQSRHANKNDCWVVDEVIAARQADKRIVVIRTDDAPVSEGLAIVVAQRQGFDVRGKPVEQWAQQLIDGLRDVLGLAALVDEPGPSIAHPMTTLVISSSTAVYPLWRVQPRDADELLFELDPESAFADGSRSRRLKFPLSSRSVSIGRGALPHRTVSRRACELVREGALVFLVRDRNSKSPIFVGHRLIAEGERALLAHALPVVLGKVQGTFMDRRYLPVALPAGALDEQTGLLAEAGLAIELALAARKPGGLLVALTVVGESSAELSAKLALELHALAPEWPVARIGRFALTVLHHREVLGQRLAALRARFAAPIAAGSLPLGDNPTAASGSIDEACRALAGLGANGASLYDLSRYRLSVRAPADFVAAVRDLGAGDVGLVAIEDLAQLEQLGKDVVEAQEQRLITALSQELDDTALFTRPCTGVIAFASRTPAATAVHAVTVDFRGKRVSNGALEVELRLAGEVVSTHAATTLPDHAAHLAEAVRHGTSLEGLPAPIALPGQRVLQAGGRAAKAQTLRRLAATTLRLAQVVTSAIALAACRSRSTTSLRSSARAWEDLAASAARVVLEEGSATFADTWLRFRELVRALYDPDGRLSEALRVSLDELERLATQLEVTAETVPLSEDESSAVEEALRRLLLSLKVFRGWTLLSVERVDMLPYVEQNPVFRVQYVDHTGPTAHGRRSTRNVIGFPLACCAHLSRLAEGLSVPLEPFVRRRFGPKTQAQVLFFADGPIAAPGSFPYRSLDSDIEQQSVDERSIPQALRGH